ncbi:39_t:CDS:2 [Ambispora gerdemannii]|uniref:39_t:CDS:1 n=1 Tax=Ambispora gerdemannii TaxID=144530 RepID=A0A9N8Z3X5_9GLOM|nr:39_t:CDS:2 [Ambispora gerdemannii]
MSSQTAEKEFNFNSSYMFVLNKKSLTLSAKPIYSPLLVAPGNTFWQLRFEINSENTACCAFWLCAIPDKCESQNVNPIWPKRKNINARIFIKESNIFIYRSILDSKFGYEIKGLGCDHIKIAKLPEKFIFGVEFDMDTNEDPITEPINFTQNLGLKKAWTSDLNNPDTSDVKLFLGDQIYYANSRILSTQSKYFQALFSEHWAEKKKRVQDDERENSANNKESTSGLDKAKEDDLKIREQNQDLTVIERVDNKRAFDYEVNVQGTDPKLFLQMLKYLYTGEVIYKKDKSSAPYENAIDLYKIADKYLIDELKAQTKEYIIASLNCENSAEILFMHAFLCPELKDEVKKFIVEHITIVSKSSGYRHIIMNSNKYPSFLELNNEIFLDLYFKDIATCQYLQSSPNSSCNSFHTSVSPLRSSSAASNPTNDKHKIPQIFFCSVLESTAFTFFTPAKNKSQNAPLAVASAFLRDVGIEIRASGSLLLSLMLIFDGLALEMMDGEFSVWIAKLLLPLPLTLAAESHF